MCEKEKVLLSYLVLKKRKEIEDVFNEGNFFSVYPFKIIYLQKNTEESDSINAAYFVPKRLYKLAVKRNLIRRRTKEAFRNSLNLCKHNFIGKGNLKIILIYNSADILKYSEIQNSIIKILAKLTDVLESH